LRRGEGGSGLVGFLCVFWVVFLFSVLLRLLSFWLVLLLSGQAPYGKWSGRARRRGEDEGLAAWTKAERE
jgi:hypothetical protein